MYKRIHKPGAPPRNSDPYRKEKKEEAKKRPRIKNMWAEKKKFDSIFREVSHHWKKGLDRKKGETLQLPQQSRGKGKKEGGG